LNVAIYLFIYLFISLFLFINKKEMAEFDSVLKALEEGALDSMATAATDDMASAAIKSAFENAPINPGDFIIETNESGVRNMTREIEGETVTKSMSEMKVDFEGDIGEMGRPPNIKNVFQMLSEGADLASEDFKQINDMKIEQFNKSRGKVKIENLEKTEKKGVELKKDAGGTPSAGEEMQKHMDELKANSKATYDKLTERLEEMKKELKSNKPSRFERWKEMGKDGLRKLVKVAAVGLGSAALYTFIKKHQNDMNGCWLIKISSGERCKIMELTCKSSKASDNQACANFNTCNGIPCADDVPADPKDKSDCDCCDPTDIATRIDCIPERPPKCKDCSSLCSKEYRYIKQGYSLKCVDVDFWGAFNDAFGQLEGQAAGIMKKILKYLVMGCAILLGVVILVYVGKFAISKVMSKATE
jgi:hypothetical protein